MNAHPDHHEALQPLLEAHLDGSLDPAGFAALQHLLRTDPAARRCFLRITNLHAQLHARSAADHAILPPAVSLKPDAERERSVGVHSTLRNPKSAISWALAAAILLAAAAVAIYVFAFSAIPEPHTADPSSAPIATLVESSGTVLVDDDVANEGGEYTAGTYSLDVGRAELLLSNRVGIALHGRTQLQVHGAMSSTLIRGRAGFACPPGMETYAVHAPRGVRIVDLGTRFDVAALPDHSTWVRVTEGLVRVDPPGREPRLLRAGEHVVVGSDTIRPVRLLSVDFNRDEPHGEIATHGPRVWGDGDTVWNGIGFGPGAAPHARITVTSRAGVDLVDASGEPTGVAIELSQPDQRWHVYRGADHATDPVRTDSIFLARDTGSPKDRIEWRITGLIPGEVYELALLSQLQDGAAVHPTDFFIADREPAVLDADLFAVFAAGGPNEPLIADADGVLRGSIQRRPDQPYAAWTGLQLRGPLRDLSPYPTPNDPPRSQPSQTSRTEKGDTE